jgi:hypothetical protein
MSNSKNFGLDGIADNVQLGKQGPRVRAVSGSVEVRNAANNAFVTLKAAPAILSTEVVTKQQLDDAVLGGVGSIDGFSVVMGDVAADGDGSWSPGAVSITDTTPVSEAIDRLNEVLSLLVPPQPPAFPNGTLSVTNSSGTLPRLSSGVTYNSTDSGFAAGATVTRVPASTVNSNTFNDVGPGNSGTVALNINGTLAGSRVLTGTGDNGTYAGLVIADQNHFPVITPGFWRSIDVSVNGGAAILGINKFNISHTAAGTTNTVYFVRDNVTGTSTIAPLSLTQSAAGTLSHSSSIPHYGSGATLTAGMTISNLSGECYYGGVDPLVVSGTNGIIANQTYTYSTMGIATPIARQITAATTITPVSILVNATNVHHSGNIQGVARNVNGASVATNLSASVVLVKNGTAGVRINEESISVSGLGSIPNANAALRVGTAAGDTPAGAPAAWVTSAALATHEAAVAGGVLSHNQINYSTGHLPVGPNLSTGRSGAQYFTFSFNRASVSTFRIVVTGTYAGCWVRLPAVSDNVGISPNAPNGWWNGFQLYDGAGVPGETGDTNAGCALGTAMTGASGTFQITFGTQSSTNATSNQILVRFRLNAGQSITALSITN